ncbi:rhamnogalacturonan acetylesterase [Pedobacter heparinus]|uniref:rhamnogalacturonan acetylesterase n=1 Tax=Pedobacter heparinus TaxID=984 RepID=UPI00292F7DD7|nr:rhamnogalacturonan acetylesterase [Pedobacter heparinus]
MKLLIFKGLALMSVAMLIAFGLKEKPIKVWLIGDSTMCAYAASRAPVTGWGMPFADFFDATVQVENRAKGGRSTRTFLSEQRWQAVADSLSNGDYVFMQFGHNDEAKEERYKDRYTPVADYKKNLLRFITETRNKMAHPVLVTPVSRMRFDQKGNALETHAEYSNAVHEVAREQQVPVVDLDKESRELFQKLGPEKTRLLFMQIEPGVNPIYPEGQKDNTHFNELGARKMAELVLRQMRINHLDLINRIFKPTVK